jgi:hypothetical protein
MSDGLYLCASTAFVHDDCVHAHQALSQRVDEFDGAGAAFLFRVHEAPLQPLFKALLFRGF